MKKLSILLPAFLILAAPLWAIPSADELLKDKTEDLLKAAKLRNAEDFSALLLASPEWQHELLDSGEVSDGDKVVATLFDIWQTDQDLESRSIDRKMATACALETPRRGWSSSEVIPRYQFFRDKWKYGLLNNLYADLSVFERRYLARGVQHLAFNTMESMEYQNEEVCLPAEKYTGACWYARWISDNPYGDTVQGPLYYTPFMESWGNYAEVVQNVGGVCGSLSNFGAAAAIANGVPAVTMGEPGHCAYAVMTKPKNWEPSYSLSWKRSLHSSFFENSWGWHILNTRAQEDPAAARQSGDLRRLAAYYKDHNNSRKALEINRQACQKYPLDWENWLQAANRKLSAVKYEESHKGFQAVKTYPAVQIYAPDGFLLYTLAGRELRAISDPTALAITLNKKLKAANERQEILSNIEKARKKDKPEEELAELIKLTELSLNTDPQLIEQFQNVDPEDKSGWQARLGFGNWEFVRHVSELIAADKTAEAMAACDKELAKSGHTPEQRCLILGAKGRALIAENKLEEAWKFFQEAVAADPDGPNGKAMLRYGERVAGIPLGKVDSANDESKK